jgi:MGT family glycosyltransferase
MKLGFVSLPLLGHLNPMTALARKLKSRGNEVVFIGVPDIEPIVRAANLNFVPLCEKEYPRGSMVKTWGEVAKLHGLGVIQHTLQQLTPGLTTAVLEHLPTKLAGAGVEALVIDIAHFFIEFVPMHLGIPYVHVWNVLNVDMSGSTPNCLFSWPPDRTPEAIARNERGNEMFGEMLAPVAAAAIPYVEKTGLQINWSDPTSTTSKLAILSQIPKEFDYPNISWPPQFHYTGPFHDDEGRTPIDFPWEKLNGKPLIYASLGTLVNGLEDVYRAILKSVGPLSDFQVVLSVGHNIDLANLGAIPSNTIVVRSAPQIELLKRATLCITHAGLNTALESLAQGVPMVAVPIGYDQPGVAARVAYHGAGEFVEPKDLTVERLSELIQQVLRDPSYRDKARCFKKVIAETRGLDLAAEVIEKAFGISQTGEVTGEPSRSMVNIGE